MTQNKEEKKETPKKEKILFAVDIEGSGALLSQHAIIAIGWCVGNMEGKILEKKRVSLKIPFNKGFEVRCLEQYWKKDKTQMLQLATFTTEAVDPETAMKTFIERVRFYDNDYDVSIVTDNPSYDIMWINYYLDVYLNHMPLNYYSDQASYRGITDPMNFGIRYKIKKDKEETSFVFNKTKYFEEMDNFKKSGIHDHWPENDAEGIYKKTLMICNL